SETKLESGPLCEGPCSCSRSCSSAEEANSQLAVSLITTGDAHAGKVGLLPGFKQNQQLFRSGEDVMKAAPMGIVVTWTWRVTTGTWWL
ncbi:unnamed protein product, partial [Ascophyllum nodosum]